MTPPDAVARRSGGTDYRSADDAFEVAFRDNGYRLCLQRRYGSSALH